MKKFRCKVCGYIHEGDSAPERCPQCKVPAEKFEEVKADKLDWAAEHVVGVAKGAPEAIIEGLKANFMGECTEVGMYLAMGRVAAREGYPEIALYWEKAALEEAEHAAKFAELLGEVVTDSTKKNLEMRVEAENGASLSLQNWQRSWVWMRSTTPFTRWLATRLATARHSRACWRDISADFRKQ